MMLKRPGMSRRMFSPLPISGYFYLPEIVKNSILDDQKEEWSVPVAFPYRRHGSIQREEEEYAALSQRS